MPNLPSRLDAALDKHQDLGLLVLRMGAGLMMAFGHGLAKLTTFPEKAATFADPIGLGPTVSLALAGPGKYSLDGWPGRRRRPG